MKKLEQYQCDICGASYRLKSKCEECENSHVQIISIIWQDFNSYKNGGQYPKRIECKMSDGSKKNFRLE